MQPLPGAAFLLALSQIIRHAFGSGLFRAELVCMRKHMAVHVTYLGEDFSGVAYIEDSYDRPECFREVWGGTKFVVEIPYEPCMVKQENGVYSSVLVVQHHRRIMTVDDVAFAVRCDQSSVDADSTLFVAQSLNMLDEQHARHDGDEAPEVLSKSGKEHLWSKKSKTVLTDGGTITYVNSGKNKTALEYKVVS